MRKTLGYILRNKAHHPDLAYFLKNIKLIMVFFTELEQIISQFVWKYKKPQRAKTILKRRMEQEESTCLIFGSTTKPHSPRKYGTGTKTEI